MTKTLLVQFDGSVLVPQGPVDLPIGCPLEVRIAEAKPDESQQPVGEVLAQWLKRRRPIDWGDMPRDGAAQHDHYLYGHPKRP